ncbi:MAG: ABC transporter ATP-binding protein [Treponema sp.]|nr:ABC transporter ATP-binding protein [Treponema sp.]
MLLKKITSGMEKRFYLYTVLSPIFMFGEVSMETTIPLVMARIVDVGIKTADQNFVLKNGMLMVLMASFSLFCGAMCGRLSSVAAFGFSKNLRKKLFSRVQAFSFSNMDHFGTDSLVTRLTTDVTALQNMYQNIIRTLVRSPIMLIFGTIMATKINARLALIFFIVIPILAAVLITIVLIVYPRFRQMLKKYDKLNRVVQENLIAIRVVKSFVRGEYENAKFDEITEDLQRTQVGAEKIVILNMPVMQLMVYACIISALWFGGKMVINAQMQTGELISFISYITQILMSLMMLSRLFVMFILSRTSLGRIMEVLDEEIEIRNEKEGVRSEERDDSASSVISSETKLSRVSVKAVPEPHPRNAPSNYTIEFQNVSFSYDKKMEHSVLQNINLSIPEGSTVGILGGTGSSKTTLVSLIPRLYEVTKGSVLVGGIDVRQWDLTALRKKIGFVLQKNVLFSGTIAENLRWGNETATDEELVSACKAADAHNFVSSFPKGYETDLGQGGVNLSGGQKQRLCIARALVKKPEILILDDSTSAVDTATDLRIRSALRSSLPDTSKIIIAQRIASVQDADFIIVMDAGKIKAVGTHEELLKANEIYKETYESQMSEN